MSGSRAELSPAVKAHIIEGMPQNIQDAYHRAVRKSMLVMTDPSRRLKFKPLELQAMDAIEIAFERARRHHRIQGLTPVRR